jgi:hypothetical protein
VTHDIDVDDASEEHQDIITEVIAVQDLKQWRKRCISSQSGLSIQFKRSHHQDEEFEEKDGAKYASPCMIVGSTQTDVSQGVIL